MSTVPGICNLSRISRLLSCTFLALCLTFSAAASTDTPGVYQALDWIDLIPTNWERPIILPAPPPEGQHHDVDKTSLEQGLDGQEVTLPGFMIPIKFEQNVVSEFLLVPFLEQHTIGHLHHDPNQMVYVYLEAPMAIHNPYAAVRVTGKMAIESVETDEGPTGYSIRQGLVAAYEYEEQKKPNPE